VTVPIAEQSSATQASYAASAVDQQIDRAQAFLLDSLVLHKGSSSTSGEFGQETYQDINAQQMGRSNKQTSHLTEHGTHDDAADQEPGISHQEKQVELAPVRGLFAAYQLQNMRVMSSFAKTVEWWLHQASSSKQDSGSRTQASTATSSIQGTAASATAATEASCSLVKSNSTHISGCVTSTQTSETPSQQHPPQQ